MLPIRSAAKSSHVPMEVRVRDVPSLLLAALVRLLSLEGVAWADGEHGRAHGEAH